MRNRVQANHLTGQKESLDLLAPAGVGHIRLDRAGAHGGDGVEGIALPEHVLTFTKWTGVLDEHVQIVQLTLVVATVEAGCRERAGTAKVELIAVVSDRLACARNGRILHEGLRVSVRQTRVRGLRSPAIRSRESIEVPVPSVRLNRCARLMEVTVEAHGYDTQQEPAARSGRDPLVSTITEPIGDQRLHSLQEAKK